MFKNKYLIILLSCYLPLSYAEFEKEKINLMLGFGVTVCRIENPKDCYINSLTKPREIYLNNSGAMSEGEKVLSIETNEGLTLQALIRVSRYYSSDIYGISVYFEEDKNWVKYYNSLFFKTEDLNTSRVFGKSFMLGDLKYFPMFIIMGS